MDPYEIEDTSDWLGNPTPLETCRHQLRMYENEFEELTLQLRQAREKIFKLVEMHAEMASERDALRAQIASAKTEAAEANRRATDIETKSNWELMAKGKEISFLYSRIQELMDKHPHADRLVK
jgi:chromosome segregation ATPase